jgi:hypothetical protein
MIIFCEFYPSFNQPSTMSPSSAAFLFYPYFVSHNQSHKQIVNRMLDFSHNSLLLKFYYLLNFLLIKIEEFNTILAILPARYPATQ